MGVRPWAASTQYGLPDPSDCYGIVGVVIGLVLSGGGVLSLLFAYSSLMPWNFLVTIVGGLIWFLSAVYCLVWKGV